MREAYVMGVGMTTFGKRPDTPMEKMGIEAVGEALTDAGLDIKQIEAVWCGHCWQGSGAGQRIMAAYGYSGIPVTNVENICASGSTAFREAYFAVATGRYEICLALGVEKMTGKFKGAITPDEEDLEGILGLTFPAVYALRAQRYMHEYGLTSGDLAKISVINHLNALDNEKTTFGEEITVDDVLNSPLISSPLHRYDCNPVSDGAAAAIVVSETVLKRINGRPVEIVASALTSGNFEPGFIDMTFEEMTHRAALEAYQQADIGPEDVDFAEVHDCFTIAEVLRVEGLGLCERGGMVHMIRDGDIEIGGKKPINASGGLLGKGHPLGATGVAQIYELTKQLRNEAGKRQITNAHIGLAHCRGGLITGTEGAACAVTILKRM
ncbi:thiolase family protein [Thermodesulfobacteriota bacterium]